ncbi:hypothetical protein ACG2LH_01115 [Zhouia sp. PK063]|uniref:hypothetical protein n=1 Tax=Zhouia sp. PK063 TaxID=3373602 RepID=UPI0037BB021A
MAIHITQKEDIFEIDGQFVLENVASIKQHFEYLLEINSPIILSLDKVSKVDT